MLTLTHEEVNEFLIQKLEIPNWKQLLDEDRLKFLRLFVRQHAQHISFNNIAISALNPKDRKNPNLSEIISTGLSGKGGVCIHVNYFVKLVLETIGYESHAVAATWTVEKHDGTHCVVVAKLYPESEELYFIDVGAGKPFWEPVPLHQLPYSGIVGGFPFEIRRTSDGIYQRVELQGSPFRGEFTTSKEKVRYIFKLEYQKFHEFDEAMFFVIANPNAYLPKFPFAFRQLPTPNENENECPNYVFIFGRTVYKGNGTTKEEYICENYDEIKENLIKYFPALDRRELDDCIEFCKQFEPIEYMF